MQGIRAFFIAALRGPAGGMLVCMLLAATLGGIAMANPEAWGGPDPFLGKPRGGATRGGGAAAVRTDVDDEDDGEAGEGRRDVRAVRGDPSDSDVTDCRVALARFREDLPSGDRGLARAIDVVAGNCRRILTAPGLRLAVERLVENATRRSAGSPGPPGSPAGSSTASPPLPDHSDGQPAPNTPAPVNASGPPEGGSGSSR